jgi:hypothetical protein
LLYRELAVFPVCQQPMFREANDSGAIVHGNLDKSLRTFDGIPIARLVERELHGCNTNSHW